VTTKPLNRCSGCKQDFTGVTHFDAHQSFTKKRGVMIVTCADPSTIGLVQNEHGRWGGNKPININGETYVPAAERPAHEFERTCTECGTVFMRPRKRGRPPTKCEGCR
jgi:hypothetical protein